MRTFWSWQAGLSAFFSAASLITLVRDYFEIGLGPILADFVNIYAAAVHFPFDLIRDAFGVSVPNWYRHLWVLSFVFVETMARTLTRNEQDTPAQPLSRLKSLLASLSWKVPVSSTLLGLIVPLIYGLSLVPIPERYPEEATRHKEVAPDARCFFGYLIIALLGVLAFFGLNRGLTN